MRILPIAIAASCALLTQPTPSQIQVCDDPGGKCQSFSKREDANKYIQSIAAARAKQARDIEQSMPIDYRDCIVAALLDEMTPDKARHYFIKDLDAHLKGKLRERGVEALPESAFPQKWREIQSHSHNTPYWQFSFLFTGVTKPGEEYQAVVGFHCGTLCLSRTLYVLKVVGNTCEIVSKQWEGGA
jgi:hypothetical protein